MTLVFDPFTPLFARTHATAFTAPADVTVGENDLVLTMDLPGLTAEDLDIELVDGALSVRGERRRPEVGEGKSFVQTRSAPSAPSSAASSFPTASTRTRSWPAWTMACSR